jgi:hypothetical protein
LAELLRLDHLTPVYHGEHGLRTLEELVRTYLTVTKDLTRVMSREKAIYRSWAIPCTGKQVYAPRHRAECTEVWGAPPGRVLLPTTRCAEVVAPRSKVRAVSRELE